MQSVPTRTSALGEQGLAFLVSDDVPAAGEAFGPMGGLSP